MLTCAVYGPRLRRCCHTQPASTLVYVVGVESFPCCSNYCLETNPCPIVSSSPYVYSALICVHVGAASCYVFSLVRALSVVMFGVPTCYSFVILLHVITLCMWWCFVAHWCVGVTVAYIRVPYVITLYYITRKSSG